MDIHRGDVLLPKRCINADVFAATNYKPILDVWPTILTAVDGHRLLIGTQTFSALVVSSFRRYCRELESVGGTTLSFKLTSKKDSNATKIFLDKESVEAGLKFAADTKSWATSSCDGVRYQLRQVKTKFHDPLTYYLLFTLVNFNASHTGNGLIITTTFDQVMQKVLEAGQEASLTRVAIEGSQKKCSE
ncbi:hypothetical protein BGZ51_001895 [Haplosporangium sp. Z 767]|nr:hypothetical protein BGZ51_001895 [Haplosporangium sp. Z 767]